MDLDQNTPQTSLPIPQLLLDHIGNSTAIHMQSGEYTYVTPWSINCHPEFGLLFFDHIDTRHQDTGGTLSVKIVRVGETFTIDLTAIKVDDLAYLTKPCELSDQELETIVVFRCVLWPTATQLGLSKYPSAGDYDKERIKIGQEFMSFYKETTGTSYTFAVDEQNTY